MKPPAKKWATIDEHAHALASLPGAFPAISIKQELSVAAVLGAFDGHMRVPSYHGGGAHAVTSTGIVACIREVRDIFGLPTKEGFLVEELGARHWSAEVRSLMERLEIGTVAVEQWCTKPRRVPAATLSESAAAQKKKILAVLHFMRDRPEKSVREIAQQCIRQRKNEGYSRSALEKIIRGHYPPMKKLGIKPLD
jgi:hypothetical protein